MLSERESEDENRLKLVISPKSERPIYEQVYNQIATGILSGELAPDSTLPSIRGIAAELGISVITVKSAYDALEKDGYIYTRAGKGCFVSPKTPSSLMDRRLVEGEKALSAAVDYCRALGLGANEIARLTDKLLNNRRAP